MALAVDYGTTSTDNNERRWSPSLWQGGGRPDMDRIMRGDISA